MYACGRAGTVHGADYDYSQSVEAVDLVGFAQDWLAGANAADLNNDGQIDGDDYAPFVEAYDNPWPPD